MGATFDFHCHLGKMGDRNFGADDLVAVMDARGVSKAVVCPMDHDDHQSLRQGNDLVADAVRRYPARLIGFASVDPTTESGTVEEFERALEMGLQGLKLKPACEGFCFTGRLLRRVIERACRAEVPVFFHSGSVLSPLMDKIAGLAADFPESVFVVSFCRSRGNWTDCIAYGKQCPNLVYDTADLPADVIRSVVDDLGAERLLLGTGFPFGCPRFEIAKVRDALKDHPAAEPVMFANAERIVSAGSRC